MIATIFAWLKLIPQLWSQLLVFIGMIEKAQHDAKFKKIDEAAGKAGDPNATDDQREDAAHDLEDIANRHT